MWLAGKCALVTGSSRGIGRGIALKLAEQGAKVGITYVQNEAAAWDTLALVRAAGSDGIVTRVDVSQPDDINRMVDSVREEFFDGSAPNPAQGERCGGERGDLPRTGRSQGQRCTGRRGRGEAAESPAGVDWWSRQSLRHHPRQW